MLYISIYCFFFFLGKFAKLGLHMNCAMKQELQLWQKMHLGIAPQYIIRSCFAKYGNTSFQQGR